MAERTFLPRDQAKAIDHPMGGVFLLRPLPTDVLLGYQEQLKESGHEIAGKGEDVEVVQKSEREDVSELVAFVEERVAGVKSFRNEVTGDLMESTPELVRALLWEMFDVETPAPEVPEEEVGEDGTARPAAPKVRRMLTATWALNEQIKLGRARKADEVKN